MFSEASDRSRRRNRNRERQSAPRERGNTANIKPETRSLIYRIGMEIFERKQRQTGRASKKVKISDIIKEIGSDHTEPHNNLLCRAVVKRWWGRGSEFESTAALVHQPRSGRPPHSAFDTPEKVDTVIQYCLDLLPGEHQKDVLEQFDINSVNTLYKYTSPRLSWVYPPRMHVNDNAAVEHTRLNFAHWATTAKGNPIMKVRNATFVDHKMVKYHGLNKRHIMVAKKKGGKLEHLEPQHVQLNQQHNPGLMTYFAANKNGVSSYIHAFKRPKKTRKADGAEMVDVWKVDKDDCMEAFDRNFLTFMKETDSDFVIADCAAMQHCAEFVDFLSDNHITMHPSAAMPHNIKNGYPPYSHPFMPLDYRVFAPYQQDISKQCKVFDLTRTFKPAMENDTRQALLHGIINKTFETDVYKKLAADAIKNYGKTCMEVIAREGNITGMK